MSIKGLLLTTVVSASTVAGGAIGQTRTIPSPRAGVTTAPIYTPVTPSGNGDRAPTYSPAPLTTYSLTPSPPSGQDAPASPPGKGGTSIKGELDQIFSQLQSGLKGTDELVARLRAAKERRPEDAERDVDQAADVLGQLVDKLKPESNLHAELDGVREAAKVNRQRVANMDKTILEESDRSRIMQSWDEIIRKSDQAGAAMETMRSSLMSALTRLRMRRNAIAELKLTQDYQAAIDAFNAWLQDLQQTAGSLHTALQTPTN